MVGNLLKSVPFETVPFVPFVVVIEAPLPHLEKVLPGGNRLSVIGNRGE